MPEDRRQIRVRQAGDLQAEIILVRSKSMTREQMDFALAVIESAIPQLCVWGLAWR